MGHAQNLYVCTEHSLNLRQLGHLVNIEILIFRTQFLHYCGEPERAAHSIVENICIIIIYEKLTTSPVAE